MAKMKILIRFDVEKQWVDRMVYDLFWRTQREFEDADVEVEYDADNGVHITYSASWVNSEDDMVKILEDLGLWQYVKGVRK